MRDYVVAATGGRLGSVLFFFPCWELRVFFFFFGLPRSRGGI